MSQAIHPGSPSDLLPEDLSFVVPAASGAAFDLVTKIADDLWNAECNREVPRPIATYRIQLHKDFNLDALTSIIPYLKAIGVSDCYLSPYLMARPGSQHGYDVVDYGRLNPEIGDEASNTRLLEALRTASMGRVLDIVANHMGVGGPNRYWTDVLENGPLAPSARFFDIEWQPLKEELRNRVLLPILEDQYGRVLEDGKIRLEHEAGAFFIRAHDTILPLAPKSYAIVLGPALKFLGQRLSHDDPRFAELQSIEFSARSLPSREETDQSAIVHALNEKEVIKYRIARLGNESVEVREALDRAVESFSGRSGVSTSFDALHALLEEQAYRLAFWKVAGEEINYRRFFDVHDLAGIRTEDPAVFEAIHAALLRWIDEGGVHGLRIDHPDGLADPRGYFRSLQETLFLRSCRHRFEREWADSVAGPAWDSVERKLRRSFRAELDRDPAAAGSRRFPIVAEKILSHDEALPEDWPIDGTVGYEFLNAVNGLFVNPKSKSTMERVYSGFTGDFTPSEDVLHESKLLITRVTLASEIQALVTRLNAISEHDRRNRDFTVNALRHALREVIACFPVYRTYIRPGHTVSARDRAVIEFAIARARDRAPTMDLSIFNFLREVLLFEHQADLTDEDRSDREAFVIRFQQTTGPVQAKGLEDTTFYRRFPLASINEVGADPLRFAVEPSAFHALNQERLRRWPGAFSTTSTHDTKRGEDTRIRINVLSEMPDEWNEHLLRWASWHASDKVEVAGSPAPDRRDEYLLYQTLVGTWPWASVGLADHACPTFLRRIQHYMVKAAREAKIHTNWIDADRSYDNALESFIASILTGQHHRRFLEDFLPFARRVANVGVIHSLSQTLLKIVSPGVPDIYQGSELWDLRLVDPDNREPVDYMARQMMLERIQAASDTNSSWGEFVHEMFRRPEDGAIKLNVIHKAMNHRRDDPALYLRGSYRPIQFAGEHRDHLIGVCRTLQERQVLAVTPRLVAPLLRRNGSLESLAPDLWGDTRVSLPPDVRVRGWRDLFTGIRVSAAGELGESLRIQDIFRHVPLSLLVPDGF